MPDSLELRNAELLIETAKAPSIQNADQLLNWSRRINSKTSDVGFEIADRMAPQIDVMTRAKQNIEDAAEALTRKMESLRKIGQIVDPLIAEYIQNVRARVSDVEEWLDQALDEMAHQL